MRKTVLIAASIVVVASASFAAWWWQGERAERAEIDAMLERAETLARTEEGLSEAAVVLEQLLAREPDDARAHLLRGDVLLRLTRPDDAIIHFRRATELTTGTEQARAHLKLGQATFERFRGSGRDADFRAASNSLTKARLDRVVEPEALEALGWLFVARGLGRDAPNADTEQACRLFDELLRKQPEHANAPKLKEVVARLRGEPTGG